MKLFSCPVCGNRLYFENSLCLSCNSQVLYDPDREGFVASGADDLPCANAGECGCNWRAVPGQLFCEACALNQTIPDLSIEGNREKWTHVEAAKRRAVYALIRHGLPVMPKSSPDDESGLAFDFLADNPGGGPGGERILTGHDNGLITLNVAEADSAERERMRAAMGETYRTLLGHFRHELGHYYWDVLIRDDPARLAECRALFGDDTMDYAAALERHYADGPPADWQDSYISSYATTHPWEDWAESWAHVLHILDTLEMAEAYGIPLDRIRSEARWDMPGNPVLGRWLALADAVNSINRCMGLPDLYPFVITPKVAEKLDFVRSLLR